MDIISLISWGITLFIFGPLIFLYLFTHPIPGSRADAWHKRQAAKKEATKETSRNETGLFIKHS